MKPSIFPPPAVVRAEAPPHEHAAVDARRLWAPVLGAPLLALVLHQTEYLLVPWACERGWRWPLHAVAIVALVGAVALGLLARASASRPPEVDQVANGVVARAARRVRFMGQIGIAIAAISGTLMLAYWIAVIAMDPCTRA